MASHARTHDYTLRLTAKIHKSPEIALRQMAAGNNAGICCSTLAEAETLVDEGISGVMLFLPVVAPSKIEPLAALNARADGLIAGVDSAENAKQLARAAREYGRAIRLETLTTTSAVVERESRTRPRPSGWLPRIPEMEGADFVGLLGYVGAHQAVASFDERCAVTLGHASCIWWSACPPAALCPRS